MQLKPISESQSMGFKVEVNSQTGVFAPKRIWLIVVSAVLFVSLGAWSFTHQVSYSPPLASERIVAIRKISRLQVLPLDTVIIPAQKSDTRWILGDGFTQPDSDGAWITALRSSIQFRVDSWTKAPVNLEMTFAPLLGPTRPYRILVVSSASSTVTKVVSGIETVAIRLNGDLKQIINISCDSIDSANSLRVGPDYRPMCAKLVSLIVKSS